VQLLGDSSISDVIAVTDHGCNRGSVMSVNAKIGIVGNIMMLKVFAENPESNPFVCKKIVVKLA